MNDMDRIEHNAAGNVAQLESVACDMMSATGSSSMGVENPISRCARNCAVTVNKHSSLTPPSLGRSIAWLADRRRDPTPINKLRTAELSAIGYAVAMPSAASSSL
jgi:hypothetical protein